MEYRVVRFEQTMLPLLPRPQQPFALIGRFRVDGREWRHSETARRAAGKDLRRDVYDPGVYETLEGRVPRHV